MQVTTHYPIFESGYTRLQNTLTLDQSTKLTQ